MEVGIGCANAVIISQDEFERLKYAEHSLSVMGSIAVSYTHLTLPTSDLV